MWRFRHKEGKTFPLFGFHSFLHKLSNLKCTWFNIFQGHLRGPNVRAVGRRYQRLDRRNLLGLVEEIAQGIEGPLNEGTEGPFMKVTKGPFIKVTDDAFASIEGPFTY